MFRKDMIIMDDLLVTDTYRDLLNDLDDDSGLIKPFVKKSILEIENKLKYSPVIIDIVKNICNKSDLVAVLTDEQRSKIADGALKLMEFKNGGLGAQIINPKTGKIIQQVSLAEVTNISSELLQSSALLMIQLELAKISANIQEVQKAVEKVRKGQENDRMAIVNSCQQRLLQAIEIKNIVLQQNALLHIISDAENAKNCLMLNQKENLQFIDKQPEGWCNKFIKGDSQKEINKRIDEIWKELQAISKISLIEAVAYYKLGENYAMEVCLKYYSNYISSLEKKKYIERLDLLDECSDNRWGKKLLKIRENIEAIKIPAAFNKITSEKKGGGVNIYV